MTTEALRAAVSAGAKGKTVESLEWSADPAGLNGYWVMTFTDGSEISFSRTMAELEAETALAAG